MSFKFTVSDVIPATPRAVYDAWLDSKAHGAMTGTKAKASAKAGARWSASDGYCWGLNLELAPARKLSSRGARPISPIATRIRRSA